MKCLYCENMVRAGEACDDCRFAIEYFARCPNCQSIPTEKLMTAIRLLQDKVEHESDMRIHTRAAAVVVAGEINMMVMLKRGDRLTPN